MGSLDSTLTKKNFPVANRDKYITFLYGYIDTQIDVYIIYMPTRLCTG